MDAASVVMALAVISGLYMAWNIGANDVANAMGTSVGSGALRLRHAIVLAIVFECAGALLSGGMVTQTISQGLVDLRAVGDDSLLLAAGMTCCLVSGAVWLHVASFMGWPVSTTHCIVGAVVGAGACVGGPGALRGDAVLGVGLGWVLTPLISAWLAYQLFQWLRRSILGHADPIGRIRRAGPFLVGVLVGLVALAFLFRNDAPLAPDLGLWQAALGALCAAAVAALIARPFFARLTPAPGATLADALRRTERVFQGFQVLGACYLAFAHGSNDAANAIGPLAAVFHGLLEGPSEHIVAPVPVLLVGAVGISIGLASYGYKVMATVGREITELTPSSGWTAVISAATVILLGSKLGLPVSTTHIMVGAVIGVGFGRSIGAINMRVLRGILMSWLVTVPFTATLAAALVAGARALLGG
ncbi:MAG: inorganic phosphate transporter [Myxococcales bacterium]|nr:inorganic phosphate transporter [Myxococcales bacterium]